MKEETIKMENIEDEEWKKHATHRRGIEANQTLEMSDGAATCKQDKAKVSSLPGRRAHEN